MTLFNTGVVPILDYGSGIWGNKLANAANVIQNKALRFYLGVHRFAPNCAIYGESGWLNPKLRRQLEIIRLWNRLVIMDDDRLTKKVFLWDKSICNNNWTNDIVTIINRLDLSHTSFERNTILDLEIVKSRLSVLNRKMWENELTSKPKLRTYRKFKFNYNLETYLNICMQKYNRSLLCQFRIGILPLNIETGRYKNIKDNVTGRFRKLRPEERICDVCNLNETEDEFHFLCICPLYSYERLLSRFLANAWLIRQNYLYK